MSEMHTNSWLQQHRPQKIWFNCVGVRWQRKRGKKIHKNNNLFSNPQKGSLKILIRIGLWGPNAIVPNPHKRFRLVVLRCKTDNYYRKGNLWVLIGRLAWALPLLFSNRIFKSTSCKRCPSQPNL